MDASDVRKKRLKQWLDEQFDGNVAAFCRYYDLPRSITSYISQIMRGSRPFGERAARNLEEQCKRPAGWLDVVPDPTEEIQPLRYDPRIVARLPVDSRELIEDFIEMVVRRSEKNPTNGRFSSSFSSAKVATKPSKSIEAASKKPISAPYSDERKTEPTEPAPSTEQGSVDT